MPPHEEILLSIIGQWPETLESKIKLLKYLINEKDETHEREKE